MQGYTADMKGERRATVTISEELEEALESYKNGLKFPPSLAALMQKALREYLHQRGYTVPEGWPGGDGSAMHEEAPTPRGEKTAAEITLENRR